MRFSLICLLMSAVIVSGCGKSGDQSGGSSAGVKAVAEGVADIRMALLPQFIYYA